MFDKFAQLGSKGAAGMKLAMLQRKIMGKKIEVEKGDIKVVVTGDGKLKTIFVEGSERRDIVEAVNDAIGQAQKWSAGEMQGMMGEISKFLK